MTKPKTLYVAFENLTDEETRDLVRQIRSLPGIDRVELESPPTICDALVWKDQDSRAMVPCGQTLRCPDHAPGCTGLCCSGPCSDHDVYRQEAWKRQFRDGTEAPLQAIAGEPCPGCDDRRYLGPVKIVCPFCTGVPHATAHAAGGQS